MSKEEFTAIMPYISADLVGLIARKNNISEEDAVLKLYNSKLYSALEDENTKVWHYSTDMLYSLFEIKMKMQKSGNPDESKLPQ